MFEMSEVQLYRAQVASAAVDQRHPRALQRAEIDGNELTFADWSDRRESRVDASGYSDKG
jgi:hypothetical protein